MEEMKSKGIEPDEFVYTAIINAYKRAHPVSADGSLPPPALSTVCQWIYNVYSHWQHILENYRIAALAVITPILYTLHNPEFWCLMP